MNESPRILVVGFGSVGLRHAQNLAKRGARITVVDKRSERKGPEGLHLFGFHTTIESALDVSQYDGAVIATPTAFHVEDAKKLVKAGCAILLEKPPAVDYESALALAAAEEKAMKPILLGYTWRW